MMVDKTTIIIGWFKKLIWHIVIFKTKESDKDYMNSPHGLIISVMDNRDES